MTDYLPITDKTIENPSDIVARRIEGHFDGTDIRFVVALPPKDVWQGRFFQYTYPLTDAPPTERAMRFGYENGGYTVQAGTDGIALGHAHAAAAAREGRRLAREFYGSDAEIFGYLYGPSGGSLQTVGGLECTRGVWQGFVPTVLAVPISLPGTFFIRALGRLVLGEVSHIVRDAVLPGGTADPFEGLDEIQAGVLREMQDYGIPWSGWEDPDYLLGVGSPDGLLGFGSSVKAMDPSYAEDFWSLPGYLGTDDGPLGRFVRSRLVERDLPILEVRKAGDHVMGVRVEPLTRSFEPLEFDMTVDGKGLRGTYDAASGEFEFADDADDAQRAALAAASTVRIDNRWNLALRSYYRHQVPPIDEASHGFAHLRRADGAPLYPQRPMLIGPTMQVATTGGASYDGAFDAKAILCCNLMDVDALPWHADWYANRVRRSHGESFDDVFRVYFSESADHIEGDPRAPHLVDYWGSVEEILVRLADWVEKGLVPPASTQYSIDRAQLTVPVDDRGGIQPSLVLERVDETRLRATASAADDRAEIVEIAWDLGGSGTFSDVRAVRGARIVDELTIEPGAGWVQARVTSRLIGREGTRGRVQNQKRIRVS